jgi:hypothetical protein
MDDNQCSLQVLKEKITTWLIELNTKLGRVIVLLHAAETVSTLALCSMLPHTSPVFYQFNK